MIKEMHTTGSNGRRYRVVSVPGPLIDATPLNGPPQFLRGLGQLVAYDDDHNECKLNKVLADGRYRFFEVASGEYFELDLSEYDLQPED